MQNQQGTPVRDRNSPIFRGRNMEGIFDRGKKQQVEVSIVFIAPSENVKFSLIETRAYVD
jgi:hypothetical protein